MNAESLTSKLYRLTEIFSEKFNKNRKKFGTIQEKQEIIRTNPSRQTMYDLIEGDLYTLSEILSLTDKQLSAVDKQVFTKPRFEKLIDRCFKRFKFILNYLLTGDTRSGHRSLIPLTCDKEEIPNEFLAEIAIMFDLILVGLEEDEVLTHQTLPYFRAWYDTTAYWTKQERSNYTDRFYRHANPRCEGCPWNDASCISTMCNNFNDLVSHKVCPLKPGTLYHLLQCVGWFDDSDCNIDNMKLGDRALSIMSREGMIAGGVDPDEYYKNLNIRNNEVAKKIYNNKKESLCWNCSNWDTCPKIMMNEENMEGIEYDYSGAVENSKGFVKDCKNFQVSYWNEKKGCYSVPSYVAHEAVKPELMLRLDNKINEIKTRHVAEFNKLFGCAGIQYKIYMGPDDDDDDEDLSEEEIREILGEE